MSHARTAISLTAAALLAGCSPPPFDSAAESTVLLKRDAEWAQAALEGKDVDKIVSYWTDDALVVPQGQPIAEGKAAVRAFVAGNMQIPGFKIHWVSEKPVFSPDGKQAWMRGTNEMTVPGPGGTAVTMTGRGISIWRRDADGQWRCSVDIFNDPPAAPPTNAPPPPPLGAGKK